MKSIRFNISIVFSLFWLPAFSQQMETFQKVIQEAQKGKMIGIDRKAFSNYQGEAAVNLLTFLKKYHKDSSYKVRFISYSLAYDFARSSSDLTIKREIVNSLTNALFDIDLLVMQYAAKRLLTFRYFNFSDEAKISITKAITGDNVKYDVILLAGVADLYNATNVLKQIIKANTAKDSTSNVGKWYYKISWAAHLALARLGSEYDLQYCIDRIKSEQDDVTKIVFLLKDLAYTRQPAAIEEIVKYLKSEKRLPPVDKGAPEAKYSEYAIHMLSQIVKDFPVAFRDVGYSDNEIQMARQWINSNPNFEIVR